MIRTIALVLVVCFTSAAWAEAPVPATDCSDAFSGIVPRVRADVIAATATTQLLPMADPPDQMFTSDIPMAIVEPTAGVTESTGLLVEVGCLCPGPTLHLDLANANGAHFADTYDVVYMSARYRDNSPYDLGKFQSIDMYRAIGETLTLYPQIDRRRIYLYGNSGGGQIALCMMAMSRVSGDPSGEYGGLFAGVFVNSAITLITTSAEVQNSGYESEDDPWGWVAANVWLQPSSSLPTFELAYRAAERYLRSPQRTLRTVPMDPNGISRYFVFHGTDDDIVDYQHLLDYSSAVETVRPGLLSADPEFPNVEVGWDFLLGTIENGKHDYSQAALDEDSRLEVVEKYGVPRGFLTAINPNPQLAVPAVMPSLDTIIDSHVNVEGDDADGRGWHVFGELNSVELRATTGYADVEQWDSY
ncbi:hypothetical protein KQI84_15265 [bacterium]|nr:hypothetical protein [bacterium]